MRQINLVVLIFTLLICSCQTDKDKVWQEENTRESFPWVSDTIGMEKFIFNFEEDEPTWLTTANYGVYYIGLKKDTIYLTPFISNTPPPPPPPPPPALGSKHNKEVEYKEHKNPFSKYFTTWMDGRAYKNWDETKIELRVNTLKPMSNSYPVLLTNIDADTTFIGYGSHIPLVMEALDSRGNWKAIQERFVYRCGVGLSSIILPPNECVLTLAPIFKGKYKTKLRLKIGKNYSEPFIGFINYRQFESRFNQYGDYKDEYKQERTTNH